MNHSKNYSIIVQIQPISESMKTCRQNVSILKPRRLTCHYHVYMLCKFSKQSQQIDCNLICL